MPENIRVLYVPQIPMPDNGLLAAVNKEVQLISDHTAGLTLNYGVFIRIDCQEDRRLLLHEFVHVGQYEGYGGIRPFLASYLMQCLTYGYPKGPLEREADEKSRRFLCLL
jgi:hypothetical protein